MFSRLIQNISAIRGQSISKSKYVTRSFSATVKLCPLRVTQNFKSYFIIIRSCTTMMPPNKNKLAEEKMAEYLKDPVNERHYKVLQLEIDVLRQSGERVPSTLKPRDWFELIQLDSRAKRKRYLDFLFGNEKKKENLIEKKRVALEEKGKKAGCSDSDQPEYLQYKLGNNSYFLRFYDTTMNNMYNWNLHRAAMYGQKLVLDCGFEDKMSKRELKNCARQLQIAFAVNRSHNQPFDLHFCNFNPKGYLHQELYSYIPTMYQPEFPINITEKSYLDLFDKQKLVYLTPDCNQNLDTFNHDDVYIVGSIVDKVCSFPLSMAKAKREGIRMAKLPIDRYLHFGSGSGKCLTLNQMIAILADVQMTGDWKHALRHVPSRKLYANRVYKSEQRIVKMYKNLNPHAEGISHDYSLQGRKKFHKEL